jgi:hypothetical protein
LTRCCDSAPKNVIAGTRVPRARRAKVRNRRISPIASRFSEVLLCLQIADIPLDRAERVFVPETVL